MFSICIWQNTHKDRIYRARNVVLFTSVILSSLPPFRMQSQTKMVNSSSWFWQWFRGRQSQNWMPCSIMSSFPPVHFTLCSLKLWPHCATILAGYRLSLQHRTSAGVLLLPAVKRSASLMSKLIGSTDINVLLHVWGKSITHTSRERNYQRTSILRRLHTIPLITSGSKSLLLAFSSGVCL